MMVDIPSCREAAIFSQFASPYSANYGRGYAISIAALVEREMGGLLPLIPSNGSTSIGRTPKKCVARIYIKRCVGRAHPEVCWGGVASDVSRAP